MLNKPGDKLVCVVNKRSAYSYLPKLVVGKTYTLKSEVLVGFVVHFELLEHPGFRYPFDHFSTVNEVRTKKLKQLNKK